MHIFWIFTYIVFTSKQKEVEAPPAKLMHSALLALDETRKHTLIHTFNRHERSRSKLLGLNTDSQLILAALHTVIVCSNKSNFYLSETNFI